MADFTGVDRKVLSSPQEAAAPQAPEQQELDLGQVAEAATEDPGNFLMQAAGQVKNLLQNADQGLKNLQADYSVG